MSARPAGRAEVLEADAIPGGFGPSGADPLVLIMSDGCLVELRNIASYEVGDGDLVVTTRRGNVRAVPAHSWAAVGVLHRDRGGAFVALDPVHTPAENLPGAESSEIDRRRREGLE